MIFLGVTQSDNEEAAKYLAYRCANLRIFGDNGGKMNLSVRDISGSALVVSQVTLYADTRRGHRPSFTESAPPDLAERLYENFIRLLRIEIGEGRVFTGVFRAMMEISLVNDGPVTILVESNH